MFGELEKSREKAAMRCIKTLSHYSAEEIERNYTKSCQEA
jgi:hypothetical protein